MQNGGYLFAAFAIIWASVFGYVLMLASRQKRLQSQLDLLRTSSKETETSGKEGVTSSGRQLSSAKESP